MNILEVDQTCHFTSEDPFENKSICQHLCQIKIGDQVFEKNLSGPAIIKIGTKLNCADNYPPEYIDKYLFMHNPIKGSKRELWWRLMTEDVYANFEAVTSYFKQEFYGEWCKLTGQMGIWHVKPTCWQTIADPFEGRIPCKHVCIVMCNGKLHEKWMSAPEIIKLGYQTGCPETYSPEWIDGYLKLHHSRKPPQLLHSVNGKLEPYQDPLQPYKWWTPITKRIYDSIGYVASYF